MHFRSFRLALAGLLLVALGSCAAQDRPGVGPVQAPIEQDRLVLLGTQGGPVPTPTRAGISSLLVVSGRPYLIDAGEGTVRRLSEAGWSPAQMRTVFITHHHVDHQADLPSLIALSWFGRAFARQNLDAVQIIGPPATQAAVQAALDYLSISERTFGQMGEFTPAGSMFKATDVMGNEVVLDDGVVRVTATGNTHYRYPSVAPNGVKDRSLSYRFDTPSVSIVFTGDTGPSEELLELARGADVLVSEISMQFIENPLPESARMPVDPALMEQMRFHHTMQHLTPEAVGQLATEAGVGMVVLTHLVPGGASSDASRYATEVGRHFTGEIIVGNDLMSIPLAD